MIKITVEKDGIETVFRCVEEGFYMYSTRDLVHDDENDVLIGSPIWYLTIATKWIK